MHNVVSPLKDCDTAAEVDCYAFEILPWFATQVSEFFPELEKRAVAVMDADITHENPPTVPVALIAFLEDKPDHAFKGNNRVNSGEEFMLEFWFKNSRYKNPNGTETPYYTYYPYRSIKNRVIGMLASISSPIGGRFEYQGLTPEVTQQAMILSFRLSFHSEISGGAVIQDEEMPITVGQVLDFSLHGGIAKDCPENIIETIEDENECS